MARPAYGYRHQQAKAAIIAAGIVCVHCGERQATVPDHDPPLSRHVHVNGSGCCRYLPSCAPCSAKQGGQLASRPAPAPAPAELVEPEGFGPEDPVWDVPWLAELRDVPEDATWPRLMTVPHPDAVDSLGPEFCAWALEWSGRPLRWWQQLAAYRLLEVDAEGVLVWVGDLAAVLSLARQLGKSWFLRALFFWRIHQADRFGVEQTVLHTGKDLAICKEVQRPAMAYVKRKILEAKLTELEPAYAKREVNGQEEISYVGDGLESRWMIRAKDAVYGMSADLAGVDEAWKVLAATIEEGIVPTLVEREQAQLLLVSTAHRRATALMIGRRASALEELGTGAGDLLIEWSSPRSADLDDRTAWRLASPHWTSRRERLIAKRLAAAQSGESDDIDEPDPIEAFRAQWLNQWPAQRRVGKVKGELLVTAEQWAAVLGEARTTGPVVMACEDNYGRGAAFAIVGQTDDGVFELGGWRCTGWDDALSWARTFAERREGSVLMLGASMWASRPDDLPCELRPAGARETATGLPLLRSLIRDERVIVDGAPDLGVQVTACRVAESPNGGLQIVAGGDMHVVRAAAWALRTYEEDGPAAPGIY